MAWIRIDDHFDEHPKLSMAGPLGWAVWLAGLAYCNRNLTDGFIPWARARSLVNWEFLGDDDGNERGRRVYSVSLTCGMVGEDVTSALVIERLVSAGLWDEVDGGFRVHDYDQYQPTKAQIEADRASNAERQAKWRERNAVTTATSNGISNGVSNGVSNEPVTSPPNPNPNPRKESADALSSASKSKPRSSATPPPDTYLPNDEQYAWALDDLGFDRQRVERETEKFLDNHRSRGSRLKDWDAAWRNWMRRAVEYAPRGKGGAPTQPVDGKPYFDGTQYRRADGLVI